MFRNGGQSGKELGGEEKTKQQLKSLSLVVAKKADVNKMSAKKNEPERPHPDFLLPFP